MKVLAFVPSGLILALPALAEMQYYDNIEAASHITAQHETRFERDSVSRSGDWIRFDVKVGWRTPDERPETEAPLRIVRYLARCETKEIAVSGVAVFDTSRRIVKSFGVPPGGWDFVHPDGASVERQWIDKACDMPV
ncbi:MAG: hypothetical protein U1F52_05940 [Burkholderiales bacterium]